MKILVMLLSVMFLFVSFGFAKSSIKKEVTKKVKVAEKKEPVSKSTKNNIKKNNIVWEVTWDCGCYSVVACCFDSYAEANQYMNNENSGWGPSVCQQWAFYAQTIGCN